MAVSQLETTPTAGRGCTRARAPCVARAISCVDTRRTGDAQLTLSVRFRGRELRVRRPPQPPPRRHPLGHRLRDDGMDLNVDLN